MKKKSLSLRKTKGNSRATIEIVGEDTDMPKSSKAEVTEEVSSPKALKKYGGEREWLSYLRTGKQPLPEEPNEEPKTNKKSKKIKPKNSKRKVYLRIFLVFLVIVGFLGIIAYNYLLIPALQIKASLGNIQVVAQELLQDFENKDLTKIDEHFDKIQYEFNQVNKQLESFSFLQSVPLMQGYYKNLSIIQGIVDDTDSLVSDILPDLKSALEKTGFVIDGEVPVVVEGEEESAFTMILKQLPEYIDLYEKVEPQILDIFDEINSLDPNYIPNVGSFDFRDKLVSFGDFTEQYPYIADETINFLRNIPDLIGTYDSTEYLLVLQNEAEMRASGGLLTAYGVLSIDNGEVSDDINLVDMWNLEIYVSATLGIDVGYRNIYGQDFLMNRGCGSTYLRAQDSGIYPDLNWTMSTFTDYYDIANKYNKINFPDYDYVMILDFAFTEEMLSLIQPLEVEGYGEVTADTLFDFIKEETDDPALSYSPERKAIIGDIANAAKEKFLNMPLTELPKIAETIIDSVYAKDIAFSSPNNERIQRFFENYGMSGEIAKDFEGDYLHVNEAQNCSLKLNNFVRDSVVTDVTINDDGSINRKVAVHWEQPNLYDPEKDLQYSKSGKFTYRAWVRIFTPEDSQDFSSDGYRASGFLGYYPKQYFDKEMLKEISDNVIQFDHRRFTEDDPIPQRDLVVEYKLPNTINYNSDGEYKLLIQKHPGKSWGEPYTININQNGEQHSVEFVLDRDKVITYKDGIITVENYSSELDWIRNVVDAVPFESL